MKHLALILQAHYDLALTELVYRHPIISCIIFVWILRYVLRWFFGINKIRRAQSQYSELMEQHNDLLQKQTDLMEQHRSVLGKLGEKYL